MQRRSETNIQKKPTESHFCPPEERLNLLNSYLEEDGCPVQQAELQDVGGHEAQGPLTGARSQNPQRSVKALRTVGTPLSLLSAAAQ